MNLENQAGFRVERRRIILLMRAIGGADFDKPRTSTRHDIRHAESAADLDQFAARDDRFLALGKRVEREQNGGGVVIHYRRILGAGQFAQQVTHQGIALAALALRKVKFQRQRFAHRNRRGLNRCLRENGATQIGMKHGAGQIEDRPGIRAGIYFKP